MDKAKSDRDRDLPDAQARFRAEYLHALGAILDSADDLIFSRPVGLILEPAPDGGALVIATDGHALGVFHDPDGHVNKPFRALLPKAFRQRCAPPPPVQMFCEGPQEYELPEWAQPGDVTIIPVCAILSGKMPHPGDEEPGFEASLACVGIETGNHWRSEDFRIRFDVVDWRSALKRAAADPVPTGVINIHPSIAAMFDPVMALAARRDERGSHLAMTLRDDQEPMIVQIEGLPNFVGALMPMRRWLPPGLPDFVAAPARIVSDTLQ